MDEDVAKLGLKYKLALKQIRELTDAKDLYQKQLEEQVKKDSVVRTQAKILCEKIMETFPHDRIAVQIDVALHIIRQMLRCEYPRECRDSKTSGIK